MIQPVSNINFKGFYSRKNELYSDSQNRCIENIKTELGDLVNSKNFEVQAGEHDTVELYHIEGLREGVGTGSSYCSHVDKIGTFDEKHPFKIDDLKKYEKESTANMLTLAIPTIMLLCGAIGLGMKACTNGVKKALNQKQLTEQVVLTVKDSATLAKDLSESFIKQKR